MPTFVNPFVLREWCSENGFSAIYDQLQRVGVDDPEDLKEVDEQTLQSLGINEPKKLNKFFIRANETYIEFEVACKKCKVERKLSSDISVLKMAVERGSIESSDADSIVSYMKQKFLEIFIDGSGTEDSAPLAAPITRKLIRNGKGPVQK